LFQSKNNILLVCYAITINKSQGQTLSNVVVYLKKSGVHTWTVIHCFFVSNLKKGLKVLIEDENEKSSDETKTLFTGKYFPASLLHSNISVACSLGKYSV
jgi:hypothetical protein